MADRQWEDDATMKARAQAAHRAETARKQKAAARKAARDAEKARKAAEKAAKKRGGRHRKA
jgi:hypothetical protein